MVYFSEIGRGESMKMWCLYTSDYDSYDDIAYFTCKEMAEKAKKKSKKYSKFYHRNNIRIKEITLNILEKEWVQYFVRMSKDGKIIECKPEIFEEEGFVCFDSESHLLYCVNTTDKDYAIKSTNEIRQQILKDNKWGDNRSYI